MAAVRYVLFIFSSAQQKSSSVAKNFFLPSPVNSLPITVSTAALRPFFRSFHEHAISPITATARSSDPNNSAMCCGSASRDCRPRINNILNSFTKSRARCLNLVSSCSNSNISFVYGLCCSRNSDLYRRAVLIAFAKLVVIGSPTSGSCRTGITYISISLLRSKNIALLETKSLKILDSSEESRIWSRSGNSFSSTLAATINSTASLQLKAMSFAPIARSNSSQGTPLGESRDGKICFVGPVTLTTIVSCSTCLFESKSDGSEIVNFGTWVIFINCYASKHVRQFCLCKFLGDSFEIVIYLCGLIGRSPKSFQIVYNLIESNQEAVHCALCRAWLTSMYKDLVWIRNFNSFYFRDCVR